MSPITTISPSLFSRAHRPPIYSQKQLRGFLALPGEIRNQIYEYYFDREHHCEVAAKGGRFKQREPHTIKLCSGLSSQKYWTVCSGSESDDSLAPCVVRFSVSLGKYIMVHGLQTNWLSSLYALSLVCKQVHLETTKFLYCKTVFIFDAPKRMHSFFGVVSSASLQNITKLHLHYNTYGHPQRTDHQVWQDKHTQSWSKACKAASKKLSNLQQLQIWVRIHDCAPKFSLREKWIKPLLQFRRLTCGKACTNNDVDNAMLLETVRIHVQTRWSKDPLAVFLNNQRLARASTELHVLYGQAVSLAIKGAREEEAMAAFNAAWEGKYKHWKHHLQFAPTGW
ncbi:hypothetical protein COCMIDRAFT_27146 [Bipolaris oryzae ATCC 44560]|uniref:DUF7730 domain-containing protein n=1 Tax=Bipolaris oryzae ATCC 44560 TaxID=930090 RepID=W6YYT9_COCMI|nr:uncharacterized protein COCMIDRAFT_27146 [Bipolaris oryzae ATCC 44560]EUC44532.1 hypothetical protein COCMIDRAFT_27146 [Bipolaris oryzae ATCC 44560]